MEFTPEQFALFRAVGLAHGIMGCLVWVIFAPVGAILLRTLPGPYAVRAHVIWQGLTYCVFTAAVGMGIWLVLTIGRVRAESSA